STQAWARRIVPGQAMTQMTNNIGRLDARRALALFADWTDRIAAGELPASKPTRPEGIERSVVVTLWDWAGPKDYLHDEVSTDKRNPRVNANGLIYGATEESRDLFPVLDPVSHKATQVKMPVRDPNTPSSKQNPMTPSPYWGPDPIWDSQTSMHNPMFDEKGRVWFTSRVGAPANPDFCKKGSEHPSAKRFQIDQAKRVVAACYGVGVNPLDGTIWGTVLGFPGYVIRLNPGSNPPATALAEVFEPPLPGYGPRGMDIDRKGVVWTPLSSGHLASF